MLCIATQKRLDPGVTCEECQLKLVYPEYKKEFLRGRQAISEELEANQQRTLPVFVPSLQIGQESRYGHVIYTKGALVSDGDLLAATGKTGEALGLKPYSVEYHAPDKKSSFFVVSLDGIPDDLKHKVKKIKIFHEVAAVKDSYSVTPATQLSAIQAETCFTHAASTYKALRPEAMSAKEPQELQSIEELKALAELIDQAMKDRLDRNASEGSVTMQDLVDQRTVAEPGTSGAAKALAGLSLDGPEPSKKPVKKRKAAASVPSALDASAATTTAPVAALMDAAPSGPSGPGSASSKKVKERDAEFSNMDDEMRRVAQLHTSTKPTASAKSLVQLVPQTFMETGTDHVRGHTVVAAAWLIDQTSQRI